MKRLITLLLLTLSILSFGQNPINVAELTIVLSNDKKYKLINFLIIV